MKSSSFITRAASVKAAGPAKKNPKAMLKVLAKAEAKMAAVRKAMDAVIDITSTLPAEFSANIHSGSVHNLDTPKEYPIWVGVQNLKNLYSLNREFQDTMKSFQSLKQQLEAYK